VEKPHIQSRAAYLYLRYNLRMVEVNHWLELRAEYLSQFDTLTCEYCGKTDLKAVTDKRSELATIDHIKPLGKGGPKFDTNNFAVSCSKCNNKKGDTYENKKNKEE